jgi:hypothetical protein
MELENTDKSKITYCAILESILTHGKLNTKIAVEIRKYEYLHMYAINMKNHV